MFFRSQTAKVLKDTTIIYYNLPMCRVRRRLTHMQTCCLRKIGCSESKSNSLSNTYYNCPCKNMILDRLFSDHAPNSDRHSSVP